MPESRHANPAGNRATAHRNYSTIAGKNPAIAGNTPVIAGKNLAIAGNAPVIAGKDLTIAGNTLAIAGKDSTIAGKDSAIAGKDSAIAGKNPAIAGLFTAKPMQNRLKNRGLTKECQKLGLFTTRQASLPARNLTGQGFQSGADSFSTKGPYSKTRTKPLAFSTVLIASSCVRCCECPNLTPGARVLFSFKNRIKVVPLTA